MSQAPPRLLSKWARGRPRAKPISELHVPFALGNRLAPAQGQRPDKVIVVASPHHLIIMPQGPCSVILGSDVVLGLFRRRHLKVVPSDVP